MTKYATLIKRMSLEQKATLITASGGWNKITASEVSVSSLAFSDGAHGLKTRRGLKFYGAPATYFPSPLAMGRSWNTSLNAAVANCIGNEARSLGVNVVDAPESAVFTGTANNARYSEDPYLTGKMLAAYVCGIQNNGIMAAVDYADGAGLSAFASAENTLREYALMPSEMAIKDGGGACVRISTDKTAENRHLVGGILKTEWQYDGMLISRDGGDVNLAKALSLGTHLLEGATASEETQKLIEAVNKYKSILVDIEAGNADIEKLGAALASGEAVSEELVDETLEKLLAFVDGAEVEADSTDAPHSSYPVNHPVMFDEKAHAAMAVSAAAECAVLLKNEGDVLPLSRDTRVAFIGDYVFRSLANASDSDFVALDIQTTESMLAQSGLNVVGACRGFARSAGNSEAEALREEALKLAKNADVAVLYLGDLSMAQGGITEAQTELLKELRGSLGTVKIVGVYFGAGLGDTSWDTLCDAVLCAGDLGQGGAEAVLSLLSGELTPSGRLTETVLSSSVRVMGKDMYGYRMCNTMNIEEKYAFGHGLSYTQFEYSGIRVSRGGVGFRVKNIGAYSGAEVAQLYIGREGSKVTDHKQLKGFVKVFLAPGESKFVEIPFDSRAFRYYNTDTQDFEIEGGAYQIFVSSSARRIELADEIEIDGSGAAVPESLLTAGHAVTETADQAKTTKKLSVAKLAIAGGLAAAGVVFALSYFAFLKEAIMSLLNVSVSDELIFDVAAIVSSLGLLCVSGGILLLSILGHKKVTGDSGEIMISSFETYKPDVKYPDDADKFDLVKYGGACAAGAGTAVSADGEAEKKATEENEAEPAVKLVCYREAKHSSFETLEAGMPKLFAAFEKYVGARGISATKEELASLVASLAASRSIVVRTDNSEAVGNILDVFAKCFDARVHRVHASAEDTSIQAVISGKDGATGIEDALRAAALSPDKISIVFIDGVKTADVREYLGDIMDYTGTPLIDFEARFERKLIISSNVWFVLAVERNRLVETGKACIVRVDADNSGLVDIEEARTTEGNEILDVYTVSCGSLTDIVTRERENSYLSEKYWRKIDKLEDHISSKISFRLSNKALNAMERYISVCVCAGAEQEEAMDSAVAALMLGRIEATSAPALVGEETLSEVMDQVFGADKDDRCRELIKLKGIK